MYSTKTILKVVVILTLLTYPYSSSHGNGGKVDPPLILQIGAISIITLEIFDIATAPMSAHRYNENLMGLKSIEYLNNQSYSEPTFSSPGQPIYSIVLSNNRFIPSIDNTSIVNDDEQQKSPSSALLLSLSATLIPFTVGVLSADQGEGAGSFLLITSGLLLGPSAGHWYAKQKTRGWITVGIRTGIGIMSIILSDAKIDLF